MYIVFVVSSLLRTGMVLWFIPRSVEPKIRHRPDLLQIIFRVSRFNAISGVSLDWLSVTKRRNKAVESNDSKNGEESEIELDEL